MIEISAGLAATLVLAFLGCVFAFGRILLAQFEKRIAERFSAQDSAREMQLQSIRDKQTTDALRIAGLSEKIDALCHVLPLEYVRREDWIRFSAAIDHKLDRLAELVMTQGGPRARN